MILGKGYMLNQRKKLPMHNFARQTQYLAPKWRAYVTPHQLGFHFSNGLTVRSLWELKQALLTFHEDVINEHIGEGKNQIADWVKNVVGDDELAKILREQTQRWGLVVALERKMMRSLNLPDYVVKRWLREVEKPFEFVSGERIKSLDDLRDVISGISEDSLKFHYQRYPNDLSFWIADIVGDYYLAESLEEINSKELMIKIVEDHMKMLESV